MELERILGNLEDRVSRADGYYVATRWLKESCRLSRKTESERRKIEKARRRLTVVNS